MRVQFESGEAASDAMPSPVLYEDSLRMNASARLGIQALTGAMADLRAVLQVTSAASEFNARRVEAAALVRQMAPRRPLPLLQFAAAALRPSTDKAGPNPMGLPEIDAFLAARVAFHQALRDLAVRDTEGNIRFESRDLTETWNAFWPQPHATEFSSALLQIAAEESGSRIVLNGALEGGGRLYSRFLAAGDPNGSIRDALRSYLERSAPGEPVEIFGVQGFNANLHTPVTRRVLDYPGLRSVTSDFGRIEVDQLNVHAEASGRTVVTECHDGPELSLLDLGFVSPRWTPPFRGLLKTLAAQAQPDLSLLRARALPTERPGVTVRPEVSVGRVVLHRRALVVDLSAFPRNRDALEQYRAVRSLVLGLGLPSTVFARPVLALEEVEWTGSEVPPEHKPVWLDVDAPVFVRVLTRLLRKGVKARELVGALPSPLTDGIDTPRGRLASEWIVEQQVGSPTTFQGSRR